MTQLSSTGPRAMSLMLPALFLMTLCSSCFTPHKEREIRGQLFDVQARLLEIERHSREKGDALVTSSEAANQRIASTAAMMEKVGRDIQKLNGDVDALRVGVQTGQMPGSDPNEPSVAQTLQGIIARLEAIEAQQSDILTAIDKAGASTDKSAGAAAKTKKPAASESKSSALADIKAVRTAFKAKKYTQISNEVPALLAKTKEKGVRRELLYFLADSYFKLGRLREAALNFNDFIDAGASGDLLPVAKLRLGDCFRHLGEPATAKLYYEEVISEHAKSPEAATAKQRLAELNKGASTGRPAGKAQTRRG
jgi:TolA-binding protein